MMHDDEDSVLGAVGVESERLVAVRRQSLAKLFDELGSQRGWAPGSASFGVLVEHLGIDDTTATLLRAKWQDAGRGRRDSAGSLDLDAVPINDDADNDADDDSLNSLDSDDRLNVDTFLDLLTRTNSLYWVEDMADQSTVTPLVGDAGNQLLTTDDIISAELQTVTARLTAMTSHDGKKLADPTKADSKSLSAAADVITASREVERLRQELLREREARKRADDDKVSMQQELFVRKRELDDYQRQLELHRQELEAQWDMDEQFDTALSKVAARVDTATAMGEIPSSSSSLPTPPTSKEAPSTTDTHSPSPTSTSTSPSPPPGKTGGAIPVPAASAAVPLPSTSRPTSTSRSPRPTATAGPSALCDRCVREREERRSLERQLRHVEASLHSSRRAGKEDAKRAERADIMCARARADCNSLRSEISLLKPQLKDALRRLAHSNNKDGPRGRPRPGGDFSAPAPLGPPTGPSVNVEVMRQLTATLREKDELEQQMMLQQDKDAAKLAALTQANRDLGTALKTKNASLRKLKSVVKSMKEEINTEGVARTEATNMVSRLTAELGTLRRRIRAADAELLQAHDTVLVAGNRIKNMQLALTASVSCVAIAAAMSLGSRRRF